jgi:hypothetical protein
MAHRWQPRGDWSIRAKAAHDCPMVGEVINHAENLTIDSPEPNDY